MPARFEGIEPILFAFGAMTYAAHPEGIVEYQKSRWMVRVSKLVQRLRRRDGRARPGRRSAGAAGRRDAVVRRPRGERAVGKPFGG